MKVKKILLVLTIVSSSFVYNNVKRDDSSNLAAKVIRNNFNDFVKNYQEETDDYTFNPNSIEKEHKVYIVDQGEYGTFFDFDKENGYMIIGNDYEIYDIKSSGQLDYFEKYKNVAFSKIDGYGFMKGEEFIPFTSLDVVRTKRSEPKKKYDVDKYTKFGEFSKIVDYKYYMNNRYGSSYKLVKSYLTTHSDYFTYQNDYSIYGVDSHGEGNCAVTSMYKSLYLGYFKFDLRKYAGFSSTNKKYNASINDSFYYDLIGNPKKYGYSNIRDLSKSNYYPETYLEIRNWLAKNKGYRVGGAGVSEIKSCLKAIIKNKAKYLVSPKSKHDPSHNELIKMVDTSCFPLFNVEDDVWGEHSMVVTGYLKYEKKKKILFFTITNSVLLLQISDHHRSFPVYIDYDKYISSYRYHTDIVYY